MFAQYIPAFIALILLGIRNHWIQKWNEHKTELELWPQNHPGHSTAHPAYQRLIRDGIQIRQNIHFGIRRWYRRCPEYQRLRTLLSRAE